jgi:hypothetical protein
VLCSATALGSELWHQEGHKSSSNRHIQGTRKQARLAVRTLAANTSTSAYCPGYDTYVQWPLRRLKVHFRFRIEYVGREISWLTLSLPLSRAGCSCSWWVMEPKIFSYSLALATSCVEGRLELGCVLPLAGWLPALCRQSGVEPTKTKRSARCSVVQCMHHPPPLLQRVGAYSLSGCFTTKVGPLFFLPVGTEYVSADLLALLRQPANHSTILPLPFLALPLQGT